MLRPILAGAVALCLIISAVVAVAAPVQYSFHTGANPSTFTGPAFGTGDFVSGTFFYDSSVAGNIPAPGAPTQYNKSMLTLAGSVGGFNFADPFGFILVGNNLGPSSLDQLGINSDPSLGNGTHNLTGFTTGAFQLVNVRLFWGLSGITEFLSDQNLPAQLPDFQGRLALDFSTNGTSMSFNDTVTFDGLFVAVIPEPETYAMLLAGLGLLGFGARHRKQ